ncbi:MAG: LCP family protein [Christensenellaceae bacterium]|nr:LCP family protein [Christensenellaceae bacterium]MEA5069948.1 LCP family protein [Christensenellaceae bacterium]
MNRQLSGWRRAVALLVAVVLTLGCAAALAVPIAPAPISVEGEYLGDEYDMDQPDENDDVNHDPDEEVALEDVADGIAQQQDALAAVGGMTNILLIGLDRRPQEKTGRSDTMILMTLDAEHNCIKMTSFQRDLYVEIPGKKNNRLNAAYVFGGPELLIKTLKLNFGVDVDHYVAVDFSALASVIDQLGGLTLTVEKKYVPRVNAIIKWDNKVLGLPTKDGLLQEAGEQLMTGKQAQAYARYRYGDPNGDAGRTVRQREVILKCMEKIKGKSMMELAQLAMNNMDKVETDMSIIDMMALAPAAFQLKDSEVRQLRIPIDNSFKAKRISGMAVYVPNREKNLKAMTEFLLEE